MRLATGVSIFEIRNVCLENIKLVLSKNSELFTKFGFVKYPQSNPIGPKTKRRVDNSYNLVPRFT
jgi:hypothetical protein